MRLYKKSPVQQQFKIYLHRVRVLRIVCYLTAVITTDCILRSMSGDSLSYNWFGPA